MFKSHRLLTRSLGSSSFPTKFSHFLSSSSLETTKRTFTNESELPEMEYRMLGGTGLKVSALSFGFWATYGVKEGVEKCVSVLRIARKGGINFFDNAEVYGNNRGDAEIIMGKAIKQLQKEDPILWRRSEILVTTKIFWGGDGVNEKGLSMKHIREGTIAALKRLELDYVDVIYCHRPDPLTSTEEVVRAMTDEIRNGRAFYWGTSEWSAQQITEAYYIAKLNNLIPPVVEQPQYNMFHRDRVEGEYLPMYKPPYNIGTTIWSPLKSGILTGKYNKSIPSGSRLNQPGYEFLANKFESEKSLLLPKIEKLMEYGKSNFNCNISELALGWCLMNKNISTVLLGATKEDQIVQNLKSLNVARKMRKNHMEDIDEILGNAQTKQMFYGRELAKTIVTSN